MGDPGGRGELRRDAPGHERARRRRAGAGGGRGRLARARGAGAVTDGRTAATARTVRIGLTGPIGCGKSHRRRLARASAARSSSMPTTSPARSPRPASRPTTRCSPRFGDARPRRRTARSTGRRSRRVVFADPDALARARGDRPSGRPAADPGRGRGAPSGRRAGRRRSRRSSSSRAGSPTLCDEVWLVTCDADGPARAAASPAARRPSDADRRIAAQAGLVERLRPAATRVHRHVAGRSPTTAAAWPRWRRGRERPRLGVTGAPDESGPPGPRGGPGGREAAPGQRREGEGRRADRSRRRGAYGGGATARASRRRRGVGAGDGLGVGAPGVGIGPLPGGKFCGIGRPYRWMIRFVVSPSFDASTQRGCPASGRRAKLNDGVAAGLEMGDLLGDGERRLDDVERSRSSPGSPCSGR